MAASHSCRENENIAAPENNIIVGQYNIPVVVVVVVVVTTADLDCIFPFSTNPESTFRVVGILISTVSSIPARLPSSKCGSYLPILSQM